MLQSIDPNLQLILNSVQLALYVCILALAIFKLVGSRTSGDVLCKFYVGVTAIASIEVGLQGYQVSQEAVAGQPEIYIFVIINLYAMVCEAATLFFLSDYWHETKEIITKTSTEIEIREQKHLLRHILIALWLVVYTAFVAYALATNRLAASETFHLVLTLGCQGIAATIMLWAILLQVIHGHHLGSAVGRYEEWLSGTAIKKASFRCVYWSTSVINLLRVLFLMAMTILIEVYALEMGSSWLAGYVYTGSNIIVLLVYLLGFSNSREEGGKISTLLMEGRESNSTRSRHETELSSSVSARSRQ